MIRERARPALDELRGVIAVLREDSGESLVRPPQPTLADLAALVVESRGPGYESPLLIWATPPRPPPSR